jgi:hypothetical protein
MFEEAPEQSVQPKQASYEDIARLAHALWEQRGCPDDSPDEDWFQAERELQAAGEEQGKPLAEAATA